MSVLQQQAGNAKSALHFMTKALKADPGNLQILKNMAELQRSRGDFLQAQHYAQAALKLDRDNVDALFISAACYLQQGEQQNAIEQFARVVALSPQDAEAHNELGNLMCARGELDTAIKHYQLALKYHPRFVDCRINLADTLLQLDNPDAAIEQYRLVLEQQPHNAQIHNRLGQVFARRGALDEAMSCFELALEQNPLLLEARINMGQLALESDPRQAENWFRSVLDIDPGYTEGYYWLGVLFQTLGQFERAANFLLQASRIDPQFAIAWYRLSQDRKFQPSDEQLETLAAQFHQRHENGDQGDETISLDYTLGRFYERRGNLEAAFFHFEHGNKIKDSRAHFDPREHDDQVDAVIARFNHDFFSQRASWGNPSRLPIFVIGMPRSGTTLVEQILSAHPAVHGAGELRLVLELATGLATDSSEASPGHSQRVQELDKQQVSDYAERQLQHLQRLQPEASHIVDKLPGNYFRLGLIKLLFPQAIIVHCRRDPMDTCWSCYQQNFERGLHFSNNLQHLGQVFRGYQRLMLHWHALFPGQIIDISYEDLVTDPETVSRSLLQACGIDWNPQVLDFAQQRRSVTSASMWQVRQPLYRSSIGRWKAYRQYLQPLQQALSGSEVQPGAQGD
jgi:tetratricopeptide (TPR) repeat protein